MPTYSTPEPIDLAINLQVGRIEVTASDRVDTIVTVSPTSAKDSDRRGTQQTKVSFDDGRLSVIGPKPRVSWLGPSAGDSVDITVALPSGSRLTAEIGVGGVQARGRLGATRIKSATGAVDVEKTDDLWLRVAHGSATVGAAEGGVDITASYGQIKVGAIRGDALLKSSYGGINVGEAGGDLEAKLSYGDLEITRALASVTAKAAFGTTRIGEVSSGSIEIANGFGAVDIGVRSGVPAWLDLSSKNGHVRNALDGETTPGSAEQTVAVRVRTQGGDITIQRAQ